MDATLNSRNEAVSQVIELTVQVYKRIGMLPPTFLQETVLTKSQLKILTLLNERERSVGDIAANLRVSLSSASRLVERLVESGLVARREHDVDRRITLCYLTEEGLQTALEFSEIKKERVRAITDFLDLEELLDVVRAMKLLDEAIMRYHAEQPMVPQFDKSVPKK